MSDSHDTPGAELETAPYRFELALISTARAVRRIYELRMAEIGHRSLAESRILAHLEGGPLSQVELARRISTSRAHIGTHIDRLEARGAVERRADPNDRRVWRVSLTPLGRELRQKALEIDAQMRERLHVGIPEAERDQVQSLLTRLQRNAESILSASSDDSRTPNLRRLRRAGGRNL